MAAEAFQNLACGGANGATAENDDFAAVHQAQVGSHGVAHPLFVLFQKRERVDTPVEGHQPGHDGFGAGTGEPVAHVGGTALDLYTLVLVESGGIELPEFQADGFVGEPFRRRISQNQLAAMEFFAGGGIAIVLLPKLDRVAIGNSGEQALSEGFV